jgi:transcriptional regulator with XRE-family HTH domain
MPARIHASSEATRTGQCAERLRTLRLDAGLTGEQLAVAAGLCARTIYAVEAGQVTPQRATLRVLAEALGCRPGDLIEPGDDHDSADRPGAKEGADVARGAA